MTPGQLDLGGIVFSSLSLGIVPVTALVLPKYKGSTFRGAFGSTFKQMACVSEEGECGDCQARSACVYHYVFETPPPVCTEVMRKYPYVPHPFVIEPPQGEELKYTDRDTLELGLKLIGKASEYLPYFVCAFDELGRIGIGKGRGKYQLKAVWADTDLGRRVLVYDGQTKKLWDECPRLSVDEQVPVETTGSLTVSFGTPTRIKFQEGLVLDLEFHMLVRSLLRRVSMLSYFHCGGRLDADYAGLIELAKGVRTRERDLAWYDWKRYSARQDRKMSLGGFVGRVTFEGDLAAFVPLLRIGEHLHVGKGTSFGLGKYRIVKEDRTQRA